VRFAELAQTSAAVAETRARSGKIQLLATCLGGLRPEEVRAAVMFLSGTLPRIGVGWAALRAAAQAVEAKLRGQLPDLGALGLPGM